MLDLVLVASLGFLGSFGHCLGMCGPIAIAFSLSAPSDSPQANPTGRDSAPSRWQQLGFHLALNLGRLCSYMLVGAAIGGLGSVLVAGGTMAGVGSPLRRGIALATGLLLIWFGLRQVAPSLLPRLPFLHPLQGAIHNRLQGAMARMSQGNRWWTPALLGLGWGLVPCGFLYAAQIKAAATSSVLGGAATLGAFGLGTLPMMVAVGASSAWLSRDRASQLFRLGGWITLGIGVLTLTRTGDLMVDYTGHLALLCLVLALIARPISKLWPGPRQYRRLLGVGAWGLALAHTVHMLEHSWGWNPAALRFMMPQHQWGIVAGAMALAIMLPLALTSSPQAQRWLGTQWRRLHLLSLPALGLGVLHCILTGSSYLGTTRWQGLPLIHTGLLVGLALMVLAVRSRRIWSLLNLEKWYVSPKSSPPLQS
ncbi:sulfite exporter TauE/SafE family protein [Leptolyngbya sp. PCC 6406]|uniref:urease accessory protein UreH domain-containing protein n=1 Tax=Leptolyngbya sp. PCC 6406 TaxID=1173264 RepID=UPI0002ACF083|nr:sulfite exporter TauE/SafE family protein [Leptolyngbya sp. PCC 6406]